MGGKVKLLKIRLKQFFKIPLNLGEIFYLQLTQPSMSRRIFKVERIKC